MGLFSWVGEIWKGVKNVFAGIMKIFEPILTPLGKILDTGWGKALMLGLSIFTMGGSLLAGIKEGMSFTGSFLDKFVAGGKKFLTEALGIEFKPEALAGEAVTPGVTAGTGGAASNVATSQTINPGDLMTGVPGGEGGMAMGPPPTGDVALQATSAGQVGGQAGAGAMLPSGAQAPTAATASGTVPGRLPPGMTPGAGTEIPGFGVSPSTGMGSTQVGKGMGEIAAQATPGAKMGFGTDTRGWLKKAAGKAWEFANTELGSELIGGAMEGYYQGKRDEAYYAEQRRIDDMWRNPNDPGRQRLESSRERLAKYQAPRGLAGAPAMYAQRIAQGGIENYAPSVPFIGGGG